jgi:hypothetical protein
MKYNNRKSIDWLLITVRPAANMLCIFNTTI